MSGLMTPESLSREGSPTPDSTVNSPVVSSQSAPGSPGHPGVTFVTSAKPRVLQHVTLVTNGDLPREGFGYPELLYDKVWIKSNKGLGSSDNSGYLAGHQHHTVDERADSPSVIVQTSYNYTGQFMGPTGTEGGGGGGLKRQLEDEELQQQLQQHIKRERVEQEQIEHS